MDSRENNPALAGAGIDAPAVEMLQQRTPLLRSHELFRDTKVVRIEHAGQCYLLRLTRGNKLILTK
jgi:hemin uptake protein HemP